MQAAAGSWLISARIDPMDVCPEVWTNPNGQHTEFGDHSFSAAWDGSAGTGTCLGPTAHHGLRAKFDGVGAIGRAPAGAHWQYEHLTCNDYSAQDMTARVTEPIGLAAVTGPIFTGNGAKLAALFVEIDSHWKRCN